MRDGVDTTIGEGEVLEALVAREAQRVHVPAQFAAENGGADDVVPVHDGVNLAFRNILVGEQQAAEVIACDGKIVAVAQANAGGPC